MHSYSSDVRNDRAVYIAIALVAALITIVINALVKDSGVSRYNWWVLIGTPAVMAVFGGLVAAYDRFLWHRSMLGIRFSQIPDLRGTWIGFSQWRDDSKELGRDGTVAVITIRQTWTSISVHFETRHSASYSMMAMVNKSSGSANGLHYEFVNDPYPWTDKTRGSHRGLAWFPIDEHCGVLREGGFMTARGYNREGAVTVERETLSLLSYNSALACIDGISDTDIRSATLRWRERDKSRNARHESPPATRPPGT